MSLCARDTSRRRSVPFRAACMRSVSLCVPLESCARSCPRTGNARIRFSLPGEVPVAGPRIPRKSRGSTASHL
ncbi:hypothetical protein NDU88_004982 [Pleurodeles waltl]|uniref:Uncharacterized protein n=1 Tax=Pleurodeles waltl TaxID=8319 RepID=A0AAV7UI86_PLEWA|nr:hypothetical protein NDU88_004982 [Pleurodeles waltl]